MSDVSNIFDGGLNVIGTNDNGVVTIPGLTGSGGGGSQDLAQVCEIGSQVDVNTVIYSSDVNTGIGFQSDMTLGNIVVLGDSGGGNGNSVKVADDSNDGVIISGKLALNTATITINDNPTITSSSNVIWNLVGAFEVSAAAFTDTLFMSGAGVSITAPTFSVKTPNYTSGVFSISDIGADSLDINLGDFHTSGSGTYLVINDNRGRIELHGGVGGSIEGFSKYGGSTILFAVNSNGNVSIGDAAGNVNGTSILVQDSASTVVVSTGTFSMNGSNGVSGTFTTPTSITVVNGIITAIS